MCHVCVMQHTVLQGFEPVYDTEGRSEQLTREGRPPVATASLLVQRVHAPAGRHISVTNAKGVPMLGTVFCYTSTM